MNTKRASWLQTLLPIGQILLTITAIGFSYSVMAADVVTDDQIRRVAKIAKASKTDITVTKERVTVTVHGGNSKRSARKVKKAVSRIMRQRNYVPKHVSFSQDSPDFGRPVPLLEDTEFRPPPTMHNSSRRTPPSLNSRGSASHPPTLDNSGAEDSEYY